MPTAVLVHHAGHRPTTFTGPGESWAAAAARLVNGRVWPRDLSGSVKEFDADEWPWVSLRPLLRADLPAVARWLDHAHVARWYAAGGPATLEHVTAHYGPAIDGTEPTATWIVEANGRSVGFCQDYLIADHPEYATLVPDPAAIGIDYAIGEPAFTGRGLGIRMIWALIESIHRRRPEARSVFAAPDHRNAASLRLLEKAGFVPGARLDEPQPDGSTATLLGCSLDLGRVLG